MNFLKIHIDKNNKKLKMNSFLLVEINCIEECFFEMNTTILKKNRKYYYLDHIRLNSFYFEENKEQFTLIFYSTKDINLILEKQKF